MTTRQKVVKDKTGFLVQRHNSFVSWASGVGIALLLVVTAEMIAADKGIGFLILSSADLMQTSRLLFGIMVLSGLGISFAWILDRLEQLLIPWRE
jgi:NitT/TauT family transport system permease protein